MADSKMGAGTGKNRKIHGGADAPTKMSSTEMEQLAGLLTKAIQLKDEGAVKLVEFVKQAAGLQEDTEIERDLGNTMAGGMTDASKRRLDDWSEAEKLDIAGSALEMLQDFELVEAEIENFQNRPARTGSSGYPGIGKPGGVIAENFGGTNRAIPLPKSVRDEAEWGSTLITLPAKKHLKLSYLEFVKLTRTSPDERQYARFLVSKFSERAVEQLVERGECKSQHQPSVVS